MAKYERKRPVSNAKSKKTPEGQAESCRPWLPSPQKKICPDCKAENLIKNIVCSVIGSFS